MYWYHSTLKLWSRMVGPGTSVVQKRAALLASEGNGQLQVPDSFPPTRLPDRYGSLSDAMIKTLLYCIDKTGMPKLTLHRRFVEYKYPSPTNPGACQGLCRFSDGWVLPEGDDGMMTQIQLSFSREYDYVSTHVLCDSCNLRLCKKCYTALLEYHSVEGANLAQFVATYYRFRQYRKDHPHSQYPVFVKSIPPEDLRPVVGEEEREGREDHSFDWKAAGDDSPERKLAIQFLQARARGSSKEASSLPV